MPRYKLAWSGVASGTGATLFASVDSSGNLTLAVTDAVGARNSTSTPIMVDQGAAECMF